MTRTAPRAGWGTAGKNPRAARWGWVATSAGASTGAAGRRAAPSASRAASTLGKPSSQARTMAESSGQCARRASGVAKRGSSASSGRPIVARSRAQSCGAPTVWSASHRPPSAWRIMPARGPGASAPPFSTAPYVMSSAATSASSIETSRWAPRPVRPRRSSAARIAPNAWVPASTSAVWR
ncbi:MAG: hypothetical protein A2W08_00520 [Candidatus Rokubacteria bacterium RBG_16_73_20]|nr:MAG: hypothetical protein A2W08_00520 [Candidatus Rokubacteria bacterium RBG_16_73_20]